MEPWLLAGAQQVVMGGLARSPSLFKRLGLDGLIAYSILSVLFFGRSLPGHFGEYHIGTTPDPALMMWCLEWWPHAISHGINLFLTNAIYAPDGFNLMWTTSFPLAAVLAWPLLHIAGVVCTYNAMCLLLPALAAWSSYLLFIYVTKGIWPALFGGFIFGFSPYMLGQLTFGHIHMLLVFLVPLAVYLILLRINGEIGPSPFVLLAAALLAGQFLLSLEVFATMSFLGAIAGLIALIFASRDLRRALPRLAALILVAYTAAAIIVSPVIYYIFRSGLPQMPEWPPEMFSADIASFLLPSHALLAGGFKISGDSAVRSLDHIAESGGYVPIPLLLIVLLFARSERDVFVRRMITCWLIAAVVLSLGPRLVVWGYATLFFPWELLFHLPLLRSAVPSRFSLYESLLVAFIAAKWLSTAGSDRTVKIGVALLAIPLILPNLSSSYWTRETRVPAFFDGAYKGYLRPGEIVLVLPYGFRGESMLWQACTDMYFRMIGGWTGWSPAEAHLGRWPISRAFYHSVYMPDAAEQLRAFLGSHRVAAVIIGRDEAAVWRPLLSLIGLHPIEVDDVTLYQIPADAFPSYREADPSQMESHAVSARLNALISGAERYLDRGNSPALLSPAKLEESGELPTAAIGPATEARWLLEEPLFSGALRFNPVQRQLRAGFEADGTITIGSAGEGRMDSVADRYRACASRVELKTISQDSYAKGDQLILLTFTREGLRRAAEDIARQQGRLPLGASKRHPHCDRRS